MTRKILHVCGLDKFIPPFISYIEHNFEVGNHHFWLNGDHERYIVEQQEYITKVGNGKYAKIIGYLKLIIQMHRAKKIILHGLFDIKLVALLCVMPWLLEKSYWVMWGGDLYVYKLGERNRSWRIKEWFRRPVIKKMGHLVTYIEGDVELARQWYGAKGQYHECLMYTSNLYKEYDAPEKTSKVINIQVGNSADPSNNHIEVFEKLLPYKNDDICIYVPLAYGNPMHAQRVIKQGVEWFSDKFVAQTDFMPFPKYLEFLGTIDIAIFNHKRQQAMGNTISLLGIGKKVYMRNETSQWNFFYDLGVVVIDVNTDGLDLNLLSAEVCKNNVGNIKKYFSEENLNKQLLCLFEKGVK